MGIFRRPREASSAAALPAITEFWDWWPQVRPRIESAINASESGDGPEGGLPADVVDGLTAHVHAIDPELEWEIGGADDRSPQLTVTGGGEPGLRGLAERWLRAAPRDTAGWRFFAARQADPEMLAQNLVLGDHEFDLEYVRLGLRADAAQARVHVTAYHPDFLFVPEEQQLQVALHVLYWALGEDDVARWVGEVSIAM